MEIPNLDEVMARLEGKQYKRVLSCRICGSRQYLYTDRRFEYPEVDIKCKEHPAVVMTILGTRRL